MLTRPAQSALSMEPTPSAFEPTANQRWGSGDAGLRAAPWRRRALRFYAWPNRHRIVALLGLSLTNMLLALAQPWPMKWLVDDLIAASASATTTTWRIPAAAAGTFLIVTASAAAAGWLTLLTVDLNHRILRRLTGDLFARLQRRSLSFFARGRVGDLMTRTVVDTWCVPRMVEKYILLPPVAAITIGLAVAIMLRVNVLLTLVALVAAPVMAGLALWLGRGVRDAAGKRRIAEGRIHAHVQQALSGVQVIQAFGQEQRELSRFRDHADDVIGAHQRTALLKHLSGLCTGLVAIAGSSIIIYLGSRSVLRGAMSVGELLVFIAYLNMLRSRMQALILAYVEVQTLDAQAQRVFEILDAPQDLPEPRGAVPLDAVDGRVQFVNVRFAYEPGQPVFENVNLEVSPGETVAIVGPSGAGKSTLVSLIARFRDPDRGAVLLDGRDLRTLRLRDLRRHIAIVHQEPVLFPVSIAENIAFGRAGASRTEIEQAARDANANDFIAALPEGYDTVIGERGATLSGGEQQRIAIARALLKNAPILILDEPTSALDSATEKSIADALAQLMRGRTTFLIAHRLSTVRRANRVLLLQGGKAIELRSFDQLIKGSRNPAEFYGVGATAEHVAADAGQARP